jgi:hypothetical protein
MEGAWRCVSRDAGLGTGLTDAQLANHSSVTGTSRPNTTSLEIFTKLLLREYNRCAKPIGLYVLPAKPYVSKRR